MYVIILAIDRLIGLGVSVSDYWPWSRGLYSRHVHNFKCGLGLSCLVRIIGYLLDWEVADLIKKVDLTRFDGANANFIYSSSYVSISFLISVWVEYLSLVVNRLIVNLSTYSHVLLVKHLGHSCVTGKVDGPTRHT